MTEQMNSAGGCRMSRQSLTQTAIAPRSIHQALFLLLAIILTLLVTQQFQRWNDSRAVSPATVHRSISHPFAPVHNQAPVDRAPALQNVEQVEQVERRVVNDTAQPHWVF